MTANSRRCGREDCGHRFLDHAPNWLVFPAPNPCAECNCPDFVEPDENGRSEP